MNRRRQMLASLPPAGDTCTLCGKFISADKILRLDRELSRCPFCGGDYAPAPHPKWQQLGN